MIIVFAILLFSFLVVIHELGHFLTAKLCGVQVNEFSIFMGPAIFKKQVGETLYSLRCIPFGGYCAMEGEDSGSDNPRAFTSVAKWKRFLILISGAAMNFLAGVLILVILFAPVQAIYAPVIDSSEPGCTIVGEGKLQVGDRILELDGEAIYLYSDFEVILGLNPGDIHDLVVERDGQRVELPALEMQKHEFLNPDGTTSLRYGFSFGAEELTAGGKAQLVWNTAKNYVRLVRLSLQMIFQGQAGLQDVAGPVGIVQQLAQTAEESEDTFAALRNVLNFGAIIAINLAVMNLLPIPALDGGRAVCLLLTAAVEAVTRKKLDAKYEGYLHGIGMILLLGLMVLITFKDIFFIFKG